MPTYDATMPGFDVGHWWNIDRALHKKVEIGSAVMVFFSVAAYDYKGKCGNLEGLDTTIALSLQALVLISDRWDDVPTSRLTTLDSAPFGVSKTRNVNETREIKSTFI